MDDAQPEGPAPIEGKWPLPYPTTKLWFVTVTAGAPRARTLGAALRKAREAAGIGVRDLARQIGVAHATVSKWENAKMVPGAESVVAYLQAVGVTGQDRERILGLVRGSDDPSWLAAGLSGASQGLAGVLECERTAVEIVHWAPLLPPGPTQTRNTARSILENDDTLSPKELDALVDLRMNRRKMFTDVRDEEAGLGPVEYTAFINENALREKPGGKHVAVDQLRELLTLAELPTVTIQIVPAGGEWHPGLSGPFIYYSFADAEPIVHLESHKASAFLYDLNDTTAYKAATSVIRRRALSPDDSRRFIANEIDILENG